MSGKHKLYFLLLRIEDARVITPSGRPLRLDPANDLNNHYREVELDQLFTKLEKDERVLKVLKASKITNSTLGELDPDPYDHADDGCYHIQLLPAFDTYFAKIQQEPEYQEYIGKKPSIPQAQNNPRPKYERKALGKIWNVLQEIEEKRQLGIDNNPIRIPCFPAYGQDADDLYEARKTILEKLQSLGAITELHKGVAGAYYYWSFRLGNNYQTVFDEYQEEYKKVAQVYQQSREEEKTTSKRLEEKNEVVYEITYTKQRLILMNNVQIGRPDFNSENDLVFSFLYAHPNESVTREQIEKVVGSKLNKSLHKIVENLGFEGDTKEVFISVSKNAIQFRNPITKKDLEEMKKPLIKLVKGGGKLILPH